MKYDEHRVDDATKTTDAAMPTRDDEFERDELETSSRRLKRKPSRIFDTLTASPKLSRVWIVISTVCALIAAVCFWLLKFDAAFVVAALGVLAWFMNLRGRFYRAANEEEQ